jgi:hypothetical protein
VGEPGVAQHTVLSEHGVVSPHPKSYVPTRASVPASIGLPPSTVEFWPESTGWLESGALPPASTGGEPPESGDAKSGGDELELQACRAIPKTPASNPTPVQFLMRCHSRQLPYAKSALEARRSSAGEKGWNG